MKLKHLLALIFSSLALLSGSVAVAESSNPLPAAETAQLQQATQNDKVNLNNATAEQLQKGLVGIGAKKAQAIIEYREQHGPFVSVEQITEVKGIGSAIFEKNKDRLAIE
ncbi:ComEA family DNA-binding protein [Gallibacterium genomosp. 1]|uniref:ComEA family DNA-binding protein n=1 Tax=Gallibacterium genomosp. 1 TaxID=155515 RepID=UPI00080286C6|nr:helix-hairpin-helix domain-containing protein [Gallibacterium genomosp. 1]OBX03712.1 competence protein ComE [Gallibacterium genomosp. 1]